MKKLLVVLGTRPEAIKLLPLVKELREKNIDVTLYSTGQHGDMLPAVFSDFNIYPNVFDSFLNSGQSLPSLLSKIIGGTAALIEKTAYDAVIVQGDTATAFGAAIAAFLSRVPVFHVEAGLRTFDFLSPFPEEYFRASIDSFCNLLFAPDDISRQNLLNEGRNDASIFVTGNTVIDALRMLCGDPSVYSSQGAVLLTVHRRESKEGDLKSIFNAVKRIAACFKDTKIFYPVHPTKRVSAMAYKYLSDTDNIFLLPPLSPKEFYQMMLKASLILTDSGGIQEEAALLGLPTLVLREKTERQAQLRDGSITLVGFDEDLIFDKASNVLNNEIKREIKINNLYPSKNIAEIICKLFF